MRKYNGRAYMLKTIILKIYVGYSNIIGAYQFTGRCVKNLNGKPNFSDCGKWGTPFQRGTW